MRDFGKRQFTALATTEAWKVKTLHIKRLSVRVAALAIRSCREYVPRCTTARRTDTSTVKSQRSAEDESLRHFP